MKKKDKKVTKEFDKTVKSLRKVKILRDYMFFSTILGTIALVSIFGAKEGYQSQVFTTLFAIFLVLFFISITITIFLEIYKVVKKK